MAGWDFSSPVWGIGAIVVGAVTALLTLGSRRFVQVPAIPEAVERRAE